MAPEDNNQEISQKTKTMRHFISNKAILVKLSEFFILSASGLFLLSRILKNCLGAMQLRPQWLDVWFQCYILKHQVTRILGLNPGGIWDGGIYYPFNEVSLLFDEPSWGVSLLIAPIWMLTKNIFPIFRVGGAGSLFLSWIFTYYFVKDLGGNKLYAFFAAAMFCLSGVSQVLISSQYCFWAFFLIPLLGIITLKIFSTSKLYWGVFWGIVFGYLAWSSAQIFFMGGIFLFLFILWNLFFNNRSKKTILTLLVGLVFVCTIAGLVIGYMYFTYQDFGFRRGYDAPFIYASNWTNLFYRSWPSVPFNLITKTPFWEYLKTNAKGEVSFGISILLLLGALSIFVFRLKESIPEHKVNKFLKLALGLGITIIIPILFAFLNMHALVVKSQSLQLALPNLAVGTTYLYYILAGIVIYILCNRIRGALKHLDFFLLLCAFLFGLVAFGPYYLTANKSVIASPTAFLQYRIIGFSGIQATARWGLVLSFTLAIGVALFLSKYPTSRRFKIFAAIFMLVSFLEVFPGVARLPDFRNLSVYCWEPRETDVFLKNLSGNGAVLEMSAFPPRRKQRTISNNSFGYALFSRLYYQKPYVRGYSSNIPHVTYKNMLAPPDKNLSLKAIERLRHFGAQYWVIHIDGWSAENVQLLKDSMVKLNKIGELDNGNTLIYEDPDPEASVGYYDVEQ